MANPIDTDHSSSRHDRSTCLFPSSSTDEAAEGRRWIESELISAGDSIATDVTSRAIAATIQAAWALTLQCFIVADVLCFGYSGPSGASADAADKHDAGTFATLYVMKLDRSEPVRSFIQRLQQTHQSSLTTTGPAGFEITLVEADTDQHKSNTAISFNVGEEEVRNGTATRFAHQEIDLSVIITKLPDNGLRVQLDYKLSHTDEGMAASVLRTFQHIFNQILTAPATLLIHNVNLCPSWDRQHIQKFTSNVSPVKRECLHDLIVDTCKQRPDQIAIRSWDGDMTYGELDDLSSRLASHLVQLGVRPETFVLSCFEKSTWAIVARLAILRAGGAYISIHASNPPIYLESVINRTKTSILLTDSHFVNQFRNTVPTVVELSPEWLRSLPATTKFPICPDIQPDNACLVLFTSGSTGTPKGIVQIHSSYVTAIQDYSRNLKLGAHTRFLQFDDYAFDISNLEFLVPLIIGGTACVPAPMRTVEDLASQIRILDANTIFLTPTVAIRLNPSDVPGLKLMCVGGEPLPKDLVRKWASHDTHLVNQYGMGEVAICCAYNDAIAPNTGAVIGRPSCGAIWLVDPASPESLLPIGAVGELIIEGPHLSRGYIDTTALHRSEAGFLKLVPAWRRDIHPHRAPARMYRSGDLGRLAADGRITYLGRKDTILKIDGCRVDALEVEHQARQFLGAADAVVVDLLGIINGKADPSLTAFLYLDAHPASCAPVPRAAPLLADALEDAGVRAKVEEMQRGIAAALPRYMVPTTWVLMSWVPRTASKKIDRKRIHVLGQGFYAGVLEERTKDIEYSQRMRVLPM
ncbi:acetyl-CoA synthetase-like protein [Pseudovirgaria hyperparasitica]|uniref:Acetyl-CoA synthetase-like protein n=1 Tax=Pseudovirgaria hyperparasitica TaxID=470096 RepID=A0A6A6VY31_9PEZI|nr:acetyl-CoA synthetase-like protein [Pseudovirgaria hyperparasitica]KAF2755568.1 acetyl-CoA synthetase-like protein [Pseudovirgaria hyperparasitica]